MAQYWKHLLCSCHEEPKICLLQFLFPPCTSLWITYTNFISVHDDNIKKRICLTCLCPCVFYPLNRKELREILNLEGTLMNDFLSHWCCHCCAIIQEYKEILYRPISQMSGPYIKVKKQIML